ncbi:hypothetical protein BV898_07321 [Hypsibius exemplaris]|uniref:Uncharacterized protein n=1 Tax=Hypsibius exemplaris TaxID=2072580 RepID=A0A1W0WU21_HYPEX|nr:hypothetical protein BV898_07321 [Hypsibius exemplaris]
MPLPLDSPYRKRISLSAMITCARVQFFIAVLVMCFQIPASGFTLYESFRWNLTTATTTFQPINLFPVDCWFPGVISGIFSLFCARFQFQHFSQAINQVTNLHQEGSATGEHPKWAGLILSRTKSFTVLIVTVIPAYGFLLVNGWGFGLANQMAQNNSEVPYERTVFLVFFHVAIFFFSVPLFILILVGMSSLTIVSGRCCTFCYPYPVYLNLREEAPKLVGLYGHIETDTPLMPGDGSPSFKETCCL